jgi:7-keto-8-aminopelargonate synthetase-like enzyme
MSVLNSGIGNYATIDGKRYSYFAGNNYLGLANHPVVKEAAAKAIKKYGINFSASRRTTGTADIHLELERELSAFKGRDAAVVFASGFQANGIMLEVLKGSYSAVFADRHAHASIVAAVPREIKRIEFYDHCDAGHLGLLLERYNEPGSLIITDGVFALTGEIAPLDRIYPLAKKYNCILVVDDAHSTGVLGRNGRGTPEYFNLQEEDRIFQTETMSKAIGSYGGFITGRNDLIESVRNKSLTYQASTALPPPVVAAGIASLKIMRENPELRSDLLVKARKLREEITRLGFDTTSFPTPIIPILFTSAEKARKLSGFLEENGIIVPFMNYPVSEEMHQVRITVSVNHTYDQIEELARMLKKWIDRK